LREAGQRSAMYPAAEGGERRAKITLFARSKRGS
jgi:hypothetical protein